METELVWTNFNLIWRTTMKDWEKCVAKNAGYKFEYYSSSIDKWIPFEEMHENHLMNVIKKIIREDNQLPFRITFLDDQTKKPIGGQYVNLIMEPFSI